MAHETVRIGIVGLGGIARNQHIPGYLRRCEDVEIVALCDVNDAALEAANEQVGGGAALTHDYRDLVQMAEVDAVDICTWPDMHYPVAMAALEQGKHVFCEKPLALNARLAREMTAAAEAAGVTTAVGFTHRVTPAARLAHRLIASGALGEIYHVNATYALGRANYADQPLTARRTRAVTGGGPLFELGPHIVDMVRWWLGEELTAVCATERTFVPQRIHADTGVLTDVDVDDAATWLANLSGGGLGVFVASFVYTARNFVQTIEVYGSEGGLLYDQARPYELQACVGREMAELCGGYGMYDTLYGLYRAEQAFPVIPVPRELAADRPAPWEWPPSQTLTPYFVAALRGVRPTLLPSFRDGMRVQEVLDAVHLSADERRWVDVGEEVRS